MTKQGRCDSVLVQVIVTESDEHGRPVGEMVSKPTRFFRASTPDIWKSIDATVKQFYDERRKEQAAQQSAKESPRTKKR